MKFGALSWAEGLAMVYSNDLEFERSRLLRAARPGGKTVCNRGFDGDPLSEAVAETGSF
jgi:hypothetical protein